MSTSKSRINVSIPDDVKAALTKLAKRDQMPTATKAVRLIEIGLETEEDEIWDKIASDRDSRGTKFLQLGVPNRNIVISLQKLIIASVFLFKDDQTN